MTHVVIFYSIIKHPCAVLYIDMCACAREKFFHKYAKKLHKTFDKQFF